MFEQSTKLNTELAAQRKYLKEVEQKGIQFNLIIADAFIRGIRDIGYKNTGTAIDELVDNSIQASAHNIQIIFKTYNNSNKPEKIAIVDDGHGMDPEMIRIAITWGGTHRENDRSGFGRYGYGLPSSTISIGKRFEVYSKTEQGSMYKGWLDLEEITEGKYTDQNGNVIVPKPIEEGLPNWITGRIDENYLDDGFKRGTVVVIDKIDRLTWTTIPGLENNLLPHLGLIYRNYLRDVNILVNHKLVEPVDPLFLNEGMRFYDYDEDRAEALEPIIFSVKDNESGKDLGNVKVRLALFPPTFQRIDKSKNAVRGNQNPRYPIMKDTQGLIVCRNGRQIDVITRLDFMPLQNYDLNWGAEIDFPATLDEEFSITTSKQQIVLSNRMWELLEKHSLNKALQSLSARVNKSFKELKTKQDTEDDKRASEKTMEELDKEIRKSPVKPERQEESKKNFEEEVKRKAKESGLPENTVERGLLTEIEGNPYRVKTISMPGAPFYYVEQMGGQQILYINNDHRFYKDVYAGSETTPFLRASLEVLLFVFGDCELDATDDGRRFYKLERSEWSKRLEIALDLLGTFMDQDEQAALEE